MRPDRASIADIRTYRASIGGGGAAPPPRPLPRRRANPAARRHTRLGGGKAPPRPPPRDEQEVVHRIRSRRQKRSLQIVGVVDKQVPVHGQRLLVERGAISGEASREVADAFGDRRQGGIPLPGGLGDVTPG